VTDCSCAMPTFTFSFLFSCFYFVYDFNKNNNSIVDVVSLQFVDVVRLTLSVCPSVCF